MYFSKLWGKKEFLSGKCDRRVPNVPSSLPSFTLPSCLPCLWLCLIVVTASAPCLEKVVSSASVAGRKLRKNPEQLCAVLRPSESKTRTGV